jgi:hypothetical protein
MPISFTVLGPEFLAADFDDDGNVDGDDLVSWGANYGIAANAQKSQGDADADGDVDGADFLVWQQQLGATPVLAAAASVPEPSAGVLLIGALAAAWRRRN